MEIWKPIPGFSRYEASTLGRLRSTNYKRTGQTRVLKPSINKSGYLQTMILADSGKYKTAMVHWFVARTYLGYRKSGYQVNHIDGNKLNNAVSNLEWSTISENIKHAYAHRLMIPKTGSLNGNHKLTESDVQAIREHAKSKGRYYGRKQLAKQYGVSEAHIKDIVTRRRNIWPHI